ncbi:MAG: hypothetical protein GYA24_19820 [Candidatus Lokiarchaeota archaeon]|nr:hypothetical protein [Candidatus Lokiarchaeota archaeon]
MSRCRNAILFIVPALVVLGSTIKVARYPRITSGQQGVKPYNFAMLV